MRTSHDITCLDVVQEMQELQDHLYFDAKRRYALGADVPEPLSDQLQSVRKLMSGELESAKVANQAITQLDLERQNKERELDVLRFVARSRFLLAKS